MSCYFCLALLLYKWKPSLHGSQSLGFPPPRNLPPTISALSPKMISTSYPIVVDLVKLDLVHMKMSSFTHEGVNTALMMIPFHTIRYFIHIFIMYGPPYPFIQLLGDHKTKINIY